MLAAASERGIDYHIVRIWEGVDRNFERQLKNRKNHKALCPIVNKKQKLKYKYAHK